jgi:hypothetical protein
LAFFSDAGAAAPPRLLLERLVSFSPLPAIAKSVFFNSFLCLLLIQNQNPPNEANNTTTIGTTMAGMSVARLLSDPLLEALDDAAAVLDVFEEVLAACAADSDDSREE